jgi:hypothetical protein
MGLALDAALPGREASRRLGRPATQQTAPSLLRAPKCDGSSSEWPRDAPASRLSH